MYCGFLVFMKPFINFGKLIFSLFKAEYKLKIEEYRFSKKLLKF